MDHFDRSRDLTFVEVGAADGITMSNTYLLEKCLGWRGISIEPDPAQFRKMEAANRSSHLYQTAVLNSDAKEAVLTSSAELSTIAASVTKEGMDGRMRAMSAASAQRGGGQASRVKVPVTTLKALVNKHNLTEIHYLSIDAEGSEMEVLKSIDLNKTLVHVITAEVGGGKHGGRMDPQSQAEYLANFGYEHVATIGMLDEIFVKNIR